MGLKGFTIVTAGFVAGLVGTQLIGPATGAVDVRPSSVQKHSESSLECVSNKSVGTAADFVGSEGLPVDEALAEAKKMVLRNPDELAVTSSKQMTGDEGHITFTFQNQKNETVAEVSLVRVGFGWRFDGGGRCVSGEES